MSHIIILLNLLFLFLISRSRGLPSISQSSIADPEPSVPQSQYRQFNPCLYNREDFLPCRDHGNAGVISPGPNQYTVHATRFQRHRRTGRLICVKRKDGELLQNVEDLGRPEVKYLFSPGAERIQPANYVNQMLVEYNIVCETGQPAFIQFQSLSLEPKNCERRCRDYVEIDTGAGGRMEFCGNNRPNHAIIVDNGRFTLKLRTSFYSSYPGFRVVVICVSNRTINPNTCHDYGGSPRNHRRAPLRTDEDPEDFDERRVLHYDGDQPPNINRSPALSLTSAQQESLSSMADSLFDVALNQVRRKVTSWPPHSYSRNDPDDIRFLSELDFQPTVRPPTPPPVPRTPSLPPYPPRPRPRLPLGPDYAARRPVRRKRVSTLQVSGPDRVQLNALATLEAVRNENSCNPVTHTMSSNYLTIAERIDPRQVQAAQTQFRAELDVPEFTP